ncbi:MAG TPA: methionine adenosyltransferase [Acidimicrobiia bacterium]
MTTYFTSESVTEGHPDKVADAISDAVLDAALTADEFARVACEVLVTTELAVVAGEMTLSGSFDIESVVRDTIRRIGYDFDPRFSADTVTVMSRIDPQSPDIAMGVDNKGAGDQGIMFGFAVRETDELMPIPIFLAHRMAERLAEVRRTGKLDYLLPDGKTQVMVRYEQGEPVAVDRVLVSSHHKPGMERDAMRRDILELVVNEVVPEGLRVDGFEFFFNPTGNFVEGGPVADTGLTGRKIIVDTYGGYARHGGGAFSGKDPTKVDRSAAYAARHAAKNIVAAGLADKFEIQLAYAIGMSDPFSIHFDAFGTEKVAPEKIHAILSDKDLFDFTPLGIIERLDLRAPIYTPTAAYGHFGRPGFSWERTDLADAIRSEAGL